MNKEAEAEVADFILQKQSEPETISDGDNEEDEAGDKQLKKLGLALQVLEQAQQLKRKQADALIQIANAASLFHDREGNCYADIVVNGHRETWSIRSKGFRRWLVQNHFEKAKTAPNSEAISTALAVIEAKAHFKCPERHIYVRTAECEGRLYVDLCNETWQAIEIDTNGWRVVDAPSVRFRRARSMQALPVPERGGNIDDLRQFLNVATDDDFVLAVTWTLAALRSSGPYPVLVPVGEQGSGKSTITRILRALVDPNTAPLRTQPRDERDLYITANNSWVIATDNVSSLPGWLSDACCRLSTGGGFATRQLYTDMDETIFESTRPIILNGIEDFVTRPDLADRAILLTLQPIPEEERRSEDRLWSDFARAHPLILGALLDTMVHGLRGLPNVKLETLPRMADFAVWATACETAVWDPGTFAQAYTGNRDNAVISVLEADPVASCVLSLMKGRKEWGGSASELLPLLAALATEAIARLKDWPSTPQALSNRLRRAAPNLRKLGVNVDFRRMPHTGSRVVTIVANREGKTPSPSSPSSPRAEKCSDIRDLDRVTTGDYPEPSIVTIDPLTVTQRGGVTMGELSDPLSSPPIVTHKSLKNKDGDDGDDGDAEIATQSDKRCRQCGGAPDGREQEHLIDGDPVWLHEQCKRFWRNGDGWGRRGSA